MALLRSVFLALLVLAVLPWGAYAAARIQAERGESSQPSTPPATGMAVQTAAAPPADAALTLHRCRTFLLTGSSCAPELVALPVTLPPPPLSEQHTGWTLDGGWRTGVIPPLQKKPPRLM